MIAAVTLRRRLAVVAPAAVALAALGTVAEGFVTYAQDARWPGDTAHLLLSTDTLPAGGAARRVLEESCADWSDVDGSAFTFTLGEGDDAAALDHADRVSGVAFSPSVQAGVLGVTYTRDWRDRRLEADILFNDAVAWDTSGQPEWWQYDLGSTARHELGHALGLRHSDAGCAALMGGACGAPGVVRPLRDDDREGVRYLYPGPAAPPVPPPPSAPASGVDWRVTALQIPGGRLSPGQAFAVSYAVENGGGAAAPQAPPVVVLFSPDRTLSAGDAVLSTQGAQAGPFAAGQGFTRRAFVQVPAAAAPGRYWVGVWIDPHDAVAEADEANNRSAVEVEVTRRPTGVNWSVRSVRLDRPVVARGDTLTVRWDTVNAGSTSAAATPDAGLFASLNDTITVHDVRVSTERGLTGVLPPGAVVPQRATFLVSLTPGTYHLGVVVDPDGAIAEDDEDDNAAAVEFEVR